MEEHQHQKKIFTRENGLSVAGGVYFVVGDILGAGIVTLPYTMRMVNWWGILLFVLAAMLMCLCGILLSYAYIFAFEDVKNRDEIRDPYAQIADKAYGGKAKLAVILILNFSLLFVCIVFLLLLGEVFSQFAPMDATVVSHRNQMRIWFVVCGLALLPLTLLGTPKDFWGVGVLATVCSIAAGLLILLNLTIAGHKSGIILPRRLKVSPETLLAVFGTVQFTFGGVLIFPTIQNDLKEPHKFPLSIILGYLIVLVIYLAVSLVAFIVLDDKIEEDLLTSFIKYSLYDKCKYFKAYTIIAQVMIAGHVLAAFVLLINPVNQQLENLLNTPFHFCWQRVIIRSCSVIFIVIMAVSVPNFGPMLSLAGGSFFTLLSVVFPILFYGKLVHQISIARQIFLCVLIVISLVSSLGNGYIEIKNVVKVVQGKYES